MSKQIRLSELNLPGDLKKLSKRQLEDLCQQIRDYIIQVLSTSGGHIASSLGTVELSVALHTIFDTPQDKIVWDVGHQCYPHKILTGRFAGMPTIRHKDGISGFTKRSESVFDPFGAGHASTSISAAVGIAQARDLLKETYSVIAVIGDGSLSGGLAYEGINNTKDIQGNFIVILNDNNMSISKPVGAISGMMTKMRMSFQYDLFKKSLETVLGSVPAIGVPLVNKLEKGVDLFRDFFFNREHKTAIIFEELGFKYYGPIDGHHLPSLMSALKFIKKVKGPVLLHVRTTKGKGYDFAEKDPIKFHGIGKFDVSSGSVIEQSDKPSYSSVFGSTLTELARTDSRIVAITAAMIEGTGLNCFAKEFPDRIFDVGIAEEHAVTAAAGMAAAGLKPVVAIYSTFLQRAYDQIVHDVCLQNLPVVFAIDRAGMVGEDGPTHHGLFDFAYLRHIPNMVVTAPKDENELRHMLFTAMTHNGPIALRYPRGMVRGNEIEPVFKKLEIGKGEIIFRSRAQQTYDIAIFAIGTMVSCAREAAQLLEQEDKTVIVFNARFVKPLDAAAIVAIAHQALVLVSVEEHATAGGFGSSIAELLSSQGMHKPLHIHGVDDVFVSQGSQQELLAACHLTPGTLANSVCSYCPVKQ